MIEIEQLTKHYRSTLAVDQLTVTVRPGRVTGFLGPNGAGKTTTMRMILGLVAPSSGRAVINGRRFVDLACPMREVGALLDARAVHGSRRCVDHLRFLAASNGLACSRVSDVLELVGLDHVAGRRAGTFSLGMSQRLGIAAALLGDPSVLLFDEPVNGLDPDGVAWIRQLIRRLAGEGRTVLVSSHLMSEMALTADHLIVLGRGRLIADESVQELLAGFQPEFVQVVCDDPAALAAAARQAGATVEFDGRQGLRIHGLDSAAIGRIALAGRIGLIELIPHRISLEDAFMRLTKDSVEYASVAELTSLEAA